MQEINIDKSGYGRQTLPTPVTDGGVVSAMHDDLGRSITRYAVRDLVVTATASLTTGTASTLLTGTTGFFADLRQITLANNSTASASVALIDESTTVRTFQVPAGNTLSITFDPSLNQSATGTNWKVDMEDITGTTVSVAAEFVREV